MQEQKPAILIQSQYIKDLSMEIPHAPQIFSKLRGKNPNVNVSLDINTEKLDDHVFNVMMNITITVMNMLLKASRKYSLICFMTASIFTDFLLTIYSVIIS